MKIKEKNGKVEYQGSGSWPVHFGWDYDEAGNPVFRLMFAYEYDLEMTDDERKLVKRIGAIPLCKEEWRLEINNVDECHEDYTFLESIKSFIDGKMKDELKNPLEE